ncbi:uncharacterized protein EDB93DRAFT_1105705 [Suillus bovinus]|uniref:uncharacterized protein n=1 Tax=Suillus bovinus TaxID=48563 RepID=UPI001B880BF2|nr:uncharacterized protein EDB93DRAFT_1105705 [Suillus bovinus]KAG2141420.1 hypothetical protein EDB93DRAFT_1105705 [Suillus bovinus]
MAGLPLDAGALMSTVLEGILYGFSILLFIGTLCSLTYKRHMQKINLPNPYRGNYAASTEHCAEDGLVKNQYVYPNGPSEYFADVSQMTYIIKHSFYVLQTLVADGVVSVWIVILPIMLWCSVAVTGVTALYRSSQASTGSEVFVNSLHLVQWVTAFFASTIATNLLSSGLLAYRIWVIQRGVSGFRTGISRKNRMPVVRVLVDAAILYSAVLVTALVLFICGNNEQDTVVDMAVPIMSIAFYMVLIRIALNKTERSYVSTQTAMDIPDARAAREAGQEHAQRYDMNPLQVYVPQFPNEAQLSKSSSTMESLKDLEAPSLCAV